MLNSFSALTGLPERKYCWPSSRALSACSLLARFRDDSAEDLEAVPPCGRDDISVDPLCFYTATYWVPSPLANLHLSMAPPSTLCHGLSSRNFAKPLWGNNKKPKNALPPHTTSCCPHGRVLCPPMYGASRSPSTCKEKVPLVLDVGLMTL